MSTETSAIATQDHAREIAEIINQIVASLGVSHRLPDDVEESQLIDELRQLRDEIDALVEIESTAERSYDDDRDELIGAGATVASLRSRLEQVTRQLSIERRRSQLERAEIFEAAVDQLIDDGRLPASDKPALLEAGRPANFTLSLLAPFQRLPTQGSVPTSAQARRLSANRPASASAKRPITPERAKQIAGSYRSSNAYGVAPR